MKIVRYIVLGLGSWVNRLKMLDSLVENYKKLFKASEVPACVLETKEIAEKEIRRGDNRNIVLTKKCIYLSEHFKGCGYYKAANLVDVCVYLDDFTGLNNYLDFLGK